jgi:hypothetical protein
MFFHFGTPSKLTELVLGCPDISVLKKKMHIAIIDDETFHRLDALRTHGFNLNPLGDINSIDAVSSFDIIVCDIKGVGSAFGSSYEGAHVISEIRKAYPDKYIISFSGATFDASYNEAFSTADASLPKDSNINQWVASLEKGLKSVGDPMQRWLRFRENLLKKGVDIFEVFNLEQQFIKAIKKKDNSLLKEVKVPDEVRDLVLNFAEYGLKRIIEEISIP